MERGRREGEISPNSITGLLSTEDRGMTVRLRLWAFLFFLLSFSQILNKEFNF